MRIEVDPTWGTDFVDATHIRNSNNGTLLTYASLNLIDLEVLEARRGVAEFQKDVRMLAEKLCQELPQSNSAALTSALDLGVLTSENPALGAWDSLNDSERDVLSTGYRKVLLFIDNEFSKATTGAEALRLLRIDESAETAEALAIEPGFNQILLKLRFVKRDGAWFLREIVQADTGLHMIAESLQPSITTILERRNSRSAPDQRGSEIIRILVLMQKDAKAALALVERVDHDGRREREFVVRQAEHLLEFCAHRHSFQKPLIQSICTVLCDLSDRPYQERANQEQ